MKFPLQVPILMKPAIIRTALFRALKQLRHKNHVAESLSIESIGTMRGLLRRVAHPPRRDGAWLTGPTP
ncbi:hypothetical protein FSZ31_07930 [Sphingorhabdus soli]|uniref:Uncharacterized protein n=1 Tax=Flavisphingopyxis soli TaxID=2601267 RepID=A0A5C6U7M8_9SPHN|nr:hypothetical protein [Sphingorhabdus soli]TXC68882.1 hypothetical protein FSZ31_07930 [Sphingorhabdus soli]